MKKKNIILYLLAGLLTFSNLPFVRYFLIEDYTYANLDGSFNYSEEGGKGINYVTVVRNYTFFLCHHPEKDQGDNRLYRTFTIKPWCFWEWGEMIFHSERFLLPYKDPASNK